MRKELILLMIIFFLISLTMINDVNANNEKETFTITKKVADITGDSKNDTIYLKALPYQGKHSFLKKIFIEIKASNHQSYQIPLESGMKPSLQIADLNHDGVNDIFTSIRTGSPEKATVNFAYSLKDFIMTDLKVPEPLEIESHFENGYKAQIKIDQTNQNYVFQLNDRKNYYEKLGLYYKGKLNEPTELNVNPYSSMKPAPYKGDEIGIRGIQTISGVANGDSIAVVKSFWYLADGKWKLIDVNVSAEKKEKKENR